MLPGWEPPYQMKKPAPAIPEAKQIAAIREDLWMSFSTMLPRKAADMPRKKMAKLKAHSVAPLENPM